MTVKNVFKGLIPWKRSRSESERFWQQVQANERFIYGSALRFTGDRFDAEDLVQQTLEKAFKHYSQLKDIQHLKSWLFTIMRNIHLKTQKRTSASARHDLFNEETGYLDTLERAAQTNPAILYEHKSVSMAVQQAVAELPETYQSVLILHYMDEYSYQEISHTLDIPIGTVMSRLSRGKQHLKKILLKHEMTEKSRRFKQAASKQTP